MGRDRDNRRVGMLGDIKFRKLLLRLWRERRECWRGVDMNLDVLIARFGAARRILAGSN
jgi:hypothetical protein